MKKLRLFGLVALVALLATGCGEKKLVCTMSDDAGGLGITMDEKMTVKFKNDKVSSVNMNVTAKVENEELKTYWSTFATEFTNEYPETDKDGLKVSTKSDDKNYTFSVNVDVDVEKASKEDLEKYDLDSLLEETGNMDEIKKSLEDGGFNCK